MTAPRYRLVLVDDHPLTIEALSHRVNTTGDMRVVGSATDSRSGLRACLEKRPALIAVNIEIPGQGAFSLVEDLAARLPSARVILLGAYFSDVLLDEALRLKVAGYLLSNEPPERVIEAFRSVCRGEQAFSPEIAERLDFDHASGQFEARFHGDLATLTNRQLTVLRHLARGESVRSVARTMSLSERAVESHKYRIMRRLGIHDRVELARYAIREGLAVP